MFVVRIETDEGLMFRAFRKASAARFWACTKSRADVDSLVDLYDLPGIDSEMLAIEAVRDGRARHVASGEKLILQDYRESSSFLAGMGIGTGAGF